MTKFLVLLVIAALLFSLTAVVLGARCLRLLRKSATPRGSDDAVIGHRN